MAAEYYLCLIDFSLFVGLFSSLKSEHNSHVYIWGFISYIYCCTINLTSILLNLVGHQLNKNYFDDCDISENCVTLMKLCDINENAVRCKLEIAMWNIHKIIVFNITQCKHCHTVRSYNVFSLKEVFIKK